MKTKLLIASLLMLIAINFSFGQKKKDKQHKVLFHLATADTLAYKALVRQLSNVLEVWPTAKIEVVVHNNGIGFMKKEETHYAKEIGALSERGVTFAVCENTMKQRKLEKSQILTVATYVPVGLAEVVMKQEEGWSYIKAGF